MSYQTAKPIQNLVYDTVSHQWRPMPKFSVDGNGNLVIGTSSYATKITESGTTTYIAKAAPGSSQSSAVWQAFKIDESSGTVITWANGSSSFSNIATDLTALSYS